MKDERIAIKVESELKRRLEKVAEQSSITEPSLVRACVTAICEYWETHGELTVPFSVIPSKRLLDFENAFDKQVTYLKPSEETQKVAEPETEEKR